MDQLKAAEDSLEARQINNVEINDAVTTRKVLKADREKLRRDKLNEHFRELGNLLDPDLPKNDKASILNDTIQVLKDLNSEVTKLKAENAVLCEESRELTQEKNELREEKASLKSDIHDLKAQHNQSRRFMVPWMTQPYPFPAALPMHQTFQPLSFLANHHMAIPNPCSTFIPYLAPVIQRLDQANTSNASTSYISGPKSFTERSSCNEVVNNTNDVATDLELKVPGSTVQKVGFSVHNNAQSSQDDLYFSFLTSRPFFISCGNCHRERRAKKQSGSSKRRRASQMEVVRANLPPKFLKVALPIA